MIRKISFSMATLLMLSSANAATILVAPGQLSPTGNSIAPDTIDASVQTQVGSDPCTLVANAAITAYNSGSPVSHAIDLRKVVSFTGCVSNIWAPWFGISPTIPRGTNFPLTVIWGSALLPSTAPLSNMVPPPGVAILMASPAVGPPYVTRVVPIAPAAIAGTACYVAQTGSDSNSGSTTAAPFLSISKAISTMSAGTGCGAGKITYVRAGTYKSSLTCTTHASTTVDTCNADPRQGGAIAGSVMYLNGVSTLGIPGAALITAVTATSFTISPAATLSATGEVWFGYPSSIGIAGGNASQVILGSVANSTVSYYPPDGIGSAIFDGGSSSNTTGLVTWVSAFDTSGFVVNGLQIQNFADAGLWAVGDTSISGNVFINNIVHDIFMSSGNGLAGIRFVRNIHDSYILNNYVYNTTDNGINIQTDVHGDGNITNDVVANNIVINACNVAVDCGSVASQDFSNPTSTNITMANNYIRDTGGGGQGRQIYLDDGSSFHYVYGNIISGTGNICTQIHGGKSNVYYGNICDESTPGTKQIIYNQYSTARDCSIATNAAASPANTLHFANTLTCTNGSGNAAIEPGQVVTDTTTPGNIPAGTTVVSSTGTTVVVSQNTTVANAETIKFSSPMTGNAWQGNLIIGNFNGVSGGGYTGDGTAVASAATSNNWYYNFFGGASSVSSAGANGSNADGSPISGFLQMSGLNYSIDPSSPLYLPPINFPPIAGHWGPPGLIMPVTGSSPAFPTGGLLPTTCTGQAPGTLRNNAGVVNVC